MNRPTEPTDLSRLIAWLRDQNRKPPELAFTSGELREAADLIVSLLLTSHLCGLERLDPIVQRATPVSVRQIEAQTKQVRADLSDRVSESMKGDHEQ